jgi:DNA polymerase-3 subunit delta
MARSIREVLAVAERLEAGESPSQIRPSIKPPFKAEERMRAARRADVDSLRHAVEVMADLELATRGGEMLEKDTLALRAIDAIAA